jgi:hypothetical protein
VHLHFWDAAAVAAVLARLIAFAIDNGDRWRRFLFLVFLALVIVAVWWVLADGGVHILAHDFGWK